MKVTIRRDNDPFKKYWWVLLVGFALVGGWICLPLLSGDSQQAGASGSGGPSTTQSLDSAENPNGAAGGVIDLSMESSGRRRQEDGSMASSLYQAPEDPAAASAGLALTDATSAGASSSLADALKGVSEKKADASGWGGKKAQKGFTAPAARLGGLSGLGSVGGGGSGGSGARSGAFGTSVAKTGLIATQGLQGAGDGGVAGAAKVMNALKSASKAGMMAANNKSNDAAAAGVGRTFDGGGRGGALGGGDSGGGGGGLYAGLDAAPSNLKANRSDLDHFEIKDVPAKPVGNMETGDELKQKLMMLAVGAVVGGVVGGVAGTAIMMAISSVSDSRNKEGKSGSNVAGQMSGKGK